MSPPFARLLAAPIAALGLVAGIAVATPAAHASITPNCVWQNLYLTEGWQSAQGDWNTGDPAYCVDNGIVYLSGSLKNPVGGGFEFAVLPPQALPSHNQVMAVYTYAGTIGQLTIFSDGEMFATGGSSAQYTSLAGISFPAAGTPLTPLQLNPGWQSAQSQYGTGDPAYVAINGIVHWTGGMTSPNNTNGDPTYFAMVPGTAEPDSCLDFNVYTYGDHVGDLSIWPATTRWPSDYGMHVWDDATGITKNYQQLTSLDGVAYANGGIWTPLNLQSGWAPVNPGPSYCWSAQTPSYQVQDHIVYLTGEIMQDTPGSTFVGTLPLSARPVHDLYITVAGGDAPEYVHISPNGNMWALGYPQSNVISLANISYQTSS